MMHRLPKLVTEISSASERTDIAMLLNKYFLQVHTISANSVSSVICPAYDNKILNGP